MLSFNVGEVYKTRSGKSVTLDGVSDYIIWGKQERILTGNIEGQSYSWNMYGDLLVNRLFLYEDFNDMDLLYSAPKVDDPQVFYFDLKKENNEKLRRRGY